MHLARTCAGLLLGLVLSPLLLSTVLASPASADDAAPGDPVSQLAVLINGERSAAGLPALRLDEVLNAEAAAHAARMVDAGAIFHNDDLFTAATKQRLTATTVGENVASNGSLDDAHRRLMASDGHRANILSPAFDRVGLGVAPQGSTWYITEVFAQSRTAEAPPAAPPATVAPAASTPTPAPVPVIARSAPQPSATPAPPARPTPSAGTPVSLTVTAAEPEPVPAAEPFSFTPIAAGAGGVGAPALTAERAAALAATLVAALLVLVTSGLAIRRALHLA